MFKRNKTKQNKKIALELLPFISIYTRERVAFRLQFERKYSNCQKISFLFGFLVHFLSYSDSLFILQAVCAFICCQISRNRPESIFTRLIFTTTLLFFLCLNPYLWAQCLWATFSGFKIISSAYETTFCDWLSRPMKMIFIPKSFSKEKQK